MCSKRLGLTPFLSGTVRCADCIAQIWYACALRLPAHRFDRALTAIAMVIFPRPGDQAVMAAEDGEPAQLEGIALLSGL